MAQWTCKSCTFLHEAERSGFLQCAVCLTPRDADASTDQQLAASTASIENSLRNPAGGATRRLSACATSDLRDRCAEAAGAERVRLFMPFVTATGGGGGGGGDDEADGEWLLVEYAWENERFRPLSGWARPLPTDGDSWSDYDMARCASRCFLSRERQNSKEETSRMPSLLHHSASAMFSHEPRAARRGDARRAGAFGRPIQDESGPSPAMLISRASRVATPSPLFSHRRALMSRLSSTLVSPLLDTGTLPTAFSRPHVAPLLDTRPLGR